MQTRRIAFTAALAAAALTLSACAQGSDGSEANDGPTTITRTM